MILYRTLMTLSLILLPASSPAGSQTPPLRAKLREADGIRVLMLAGSNQERGYAEGYLLADEILELVEGFALSKKVMPVAQLWDRVLLPQVRKRVVLPEHLRQRYAAIIQGMTARYGKAPTAKALGRPLTVADFVASVTIPDLAGLLCSSYAVWGAEFTREGPLVGRNLDYFATETLTRSVMLIVHAPAGDRRGWVSIGWPGASGCVTGISDAGLFVAIHDVRRWVREDERFTPRLVALQELIERVDPREEDGGDPAIRARDLLREYSYGVGGNVLIAWPGGPRGPGAGVLEIDGEPTLDHGVSLRRPQSNSFIACTNHFRLRRKEKECRRYDVLLKGLTNAVADPLDLDSGWTLIKKPSKRNTIYRLVTDLSSGEVRLERRLQPGAATYTECRFNARQLLREAAELTR